MAAVIICYKPVIVLVVISFWEFEPIEASKYLLQVIFLSIPSTFTHSRTHTVNQ